MSIIKSGLSRRDVIKGLGAVGLLSSLRAEQLLAQTGATPVRVLCVVLQHGWGIASDSNRFLSGDGSDYRFPDGLDPFNSIKDRCVAIENLRTLGEWGNNHDLSYADVLTAGVLQGTQSSSFDGHMPLSVTPSLDFLLQERSGQNSFRFSAGYRSWGVQYHPVSFDRNATVLPFYTKASDAYGSLFKNIPDAGTGTASNSEAALLQKVFSMIKNPAPGYIESLPASEKAKIERYLLAVDDLQGKKSAVVGYAGSERLKAIPVAGQSHTENLASYLDMVKVGFANQMTTSAVVGIGDINDIADFHHTHAHANSDIWWNTRRAFAQTIVSFVNELDQIIDTDGRTLLDNTLILLSGEVGSGSHNIVRKGHILIGGGAHRLNSGRRLVAPVVTDRAERDALVRESANGTMVRQVVWSGSAGARTNADLLREIGNIAGLKLKEFGLPSQNSGDVL
ncbi:MAG: DUF1552 domain-containing protein [Marinagarivorans sp.]|nr:DUF1552 domain-containing protein [Marinagarivorans sp.]MDZ7925511.1 DUF1552 domain-containing protein [Marinagarivorans sp.]